MGHVLARVEGGRVFLLAPNELVLSLHRVGRLADLRRVVVEGVVHVLHIHHVHVVVPALDHWQLLDVRVLVVTIGRITHIVPSLGGHGAFLVVAHLEVGQLLLSLHGLLLRRVDVGDLRLLVGEIAHGTQLVRVLAVLGERVGEVGCAHPGRLLRNRILLLHHVFLLADLSEPRVLEGL